MIRRAAVALDGTTFEFRRPRSTTLWRAPSAALDVRLQRRSWDNQRTIVVEHMGEVVRLAVSRDKRFPMVALAMPYHRPILDAYALDLVLALRAAGARVTIEAVLDADEQERLADG
ncbi:hypothetical protein JQN72_06630 [Phycicoccus sp. CSK15P-2]|uniref:hypothetical protein n=1 Tax=Phycicoccus sp. CSK15P-2 TaxID=2807627 RepID=UPI00194DEB78|nr:hypothetical protein [Phycicoccus sp. CSK15P-2]MBM6403918.1 hypothetical protein [Phycicoccus sp. CSK15P-2]